MIPYMWDRVKGHIQRGLERGSNYSLDDVFIGLCDQSMQLWIAESTDIVAALVTTIQTKDDTTYCLLLCAGGSAMNEWADCLPALEDWARDNGCSELRIYGRRGWIRQLGFEEMYTASRKYL